MEIIGKAVNHGGGRGVRGAIRQWDDEQIDDPGGRPDRRRSCVGVLRLSGQQAAAE